MLSQRMCVRWEIGNWQPHSLNDSPQFTTFGEAGATPFMSLGFNFPVLGEVGGQLSLGYWSLRDLDEIERVHAVVLYPVVLEIKHWLVPNPRLAAYATYGAGLYWGVENETDIFHERFQSARRGWGLNIGAGFDWAFSRHLGLGMAFQYHFVIFNKSLGGVSDFSGPKIAAAILYLL